MTIIGLTGGIGSGKSAVADILQRQGAEIIDTDQIAREIVMPHEAAYEAIVGHFGPGILHDDKTLNRNALREHIFEDETHRLWLEDLLHPQIRVIAEQRAKMSQAELRVVVIPLLKRRDDYPYVEKVWTVEAPEKVRIKRVMERDDVDKEQAKAIIDSQPTVKTRSDMADVVIDNNGDMSKLERVVQSVLKE